MVLLTIDWALAPLSTIVWLGATSLRFYVRCPRCDHFFSNWHLTESWLALVRVFAYPNARACEHCGLSRGSSGLPNVYVQGDDAPETRDARREKIFHLPLLLLLLVLAALFYLKVLKVRMHGEAPAGPVDPVVESMGRPRF